MKQLLIGFFLLLSVCAAQAQPVGRFSLIGNTYVFAKANGDVIGFFPAGTVSITSLGNAINVSKGGQTYANYDPTNFLDLNGNAYGVSVNAALANFKANNLIASSGGSSSSGSSLVLATQAQAVAGLDNETYMSPFRTAQAISNALTGYSTTSAANALYKSINYQPAFGDITGRPTTRAGYGITDAEPTIAPGTSGQYWSGNKTWVNLPTIPTNNNQLTNGAGYQTATDVGNALAGKQNTLVSGTTLKTINGIPLLGSGDLTISSGSGGAATTDAGQLTSGTLDDARLSVNVVKQTAAQTLTNKTVNGVSPTTFGFLDFTSSGQGQLNGKEPAIPAGTSGQYWRWDKTWANFPTIPTNNNQLTNGAGYQTAADVGNAVAGKQATLVSGTNLKTINGTSLLGAGDIVISGGSGSSGASVPTQQSYSSGPTYTITSSTSNIWLLINPSSQVATLALTLPSSPVDGQSVLISFGGSLIAGTVVTNLSIAPNSGQTVLQATAPSSPQAGETIAYRYTAASSIWYRQH